MLKSHNGARCGKIEKTKKRAVSKVTPIIIVVGILALVLIAVVSLFSAPLESHTTSQNIRYDLRGIAPTEGYNIFAGNGTASDGRISITLNNYAIINTSEANFEKPSCCPNTTFSNLDLFLMNVTIANIGKGNASVNSSFGAWWINENDPSGKVQSNGILLQNASFPEGEFPSSTYPVYVYGKGGVPLFPGKSLTLWLFFYISGLGYPFPSPHALASTIQLLGISYREILYGGNIASDNSTYCLNVSYACYDFQSELIALNTQN